MRKKFVAGNWKMTKNVQESIELTSEIVNMIKDEVNGEVEVVLCPTFVSISNVAALSQGVSKISVGGQNCHQENSGAYTGEISASMLKSVGCQWVILGHSERRQYFNESSSLIASKVNSALNASLKVMYCCGETLEERNSNAHFDVIKGQVSEGLFHLSAEQMTNMAIAYEPVWAIGTGVTASTEQAQEVHAFIRSLLNDKYGNDIAASVRILYGGSVKPDNAVELFSQEDIDGGLIGGAALQSRSFTDIVKAAQ
ncbi:MAG: triose-phosphate isomerase [Bacteroidetes bacterium]|nr:triose-phosphate isomerase [Bacteroidota bacterium]